MSAPLTKESSIKLLINSARLGQQMGAFNLRDCATLKQVFAFFDPNVTEKPDFEKAVNPELVAVEFLLQAVQKAQRHGGELAYTIEDAALLWDVAQFWIREGSKVGSEDASTKRRGKSSSVRQKTTDFDDESVE